MSSSEPLHLVCPHCHTTNRVRQADLAQSPGCGQCHRPLFDAKPAALDQAAFERHLMRSDLPLLVDFWAPWCGRAVRWRPLSSKPRRSSSRMCGWRR